MGKYLDALNDWNVTPYNATNSIASLKNDSVSEAFRVAKEETSDRLGPGLLLFIWIMIYVHISAAENNFNLSPVHSMISTNAIILCFAIFFLYIGIMNDSQTLIWCVLVYFLAQVWGILRTTN